MNQDSKSLKLPKVFQLTMSKQTDKYRLKRLIIVSLTISLRFPNPIEVTKAVENCIFIHKQSLNKLLQVCIQTLNTVLLPPKEHLNLPFGCYASRMLKDHSSGMSYFVDITRERMQRHGFRFVRIFQQTTFNQKYIGNVDIPWSHFDDVTRELNCFITTPGWLATFFPKASKLQRTKL